MKTELTLHERSLTLSRFPIHSNETLQAWDAGDEYLINHIEEMALAKGKNILILNDHFGALSCWFSQDHHVTVMSDSWVAHQGIAHNLQINHCPEITRLKSTEPLPSNIDLVLIQIPRNNRYLTWQLTKLREYISSDVPVIAVNKAKEIHSSTLKIFEKHLGSTSTSLAWKKHRLVFSHANCIPVQNVEPLTTWDVEGHGMTLGNLPNVYSGEALDLGARFMLQHIPSDPNYQHIIDLGCGNGVLSVAAARLNPQAKITSIDESYMAVESARHNLKYNLDNDDNIQCIANNCLDNYQGEEASLILCNPPFHQQQAITDHIAWQMFCDAKHVLAKGGQLIVIGNRHLGYDGKLSRLFSKPQVKVIASNKKFVILQATK
ncbi:50S rRNA methyltransferase [Vibrio genomosp. F10 str. ZF-129]|uniref:Ribosomal RNA large subunit methyltransferase G n=1 Tax=Vibrio genomosp. F10 str. ZF-129 TaxID=1187848 RepID=A0A1E5BKQ3_9VIBR|nr:methyltransferase [Vibrio genomosp. F10]OEE38454.1 50S rRNA methyltransferase [Vibrio genomosp. F10 str. ZF-129]